MRDTDEKGIAMNAQGMNRRQFLTGAAALGSTAAALSAAPVLGYAAEGADEEPAVDPEVGPIAPVCVPKAWDLEADVVVVGSGGGGVNAAARAAELGASVILIEKSPSMGGNSSQAGGSIVMGGCRALDEKERAYPSWPYDVDAWVDWIMDSRIQCTNDDFLYLVGTNTGPAHDWMADCGVQWIVSSGTTIIPAGGSKDPLAPSRQKDTLAVMYQFGIDHGAQYLFDTPAQTLVMNDEGRVVGVKAQSEAGDDLYIRADKGVILCAGGFAANKKMLAEYCPSAIDNCGNCYVSQADSGECVRMGMGAGGTLVGKDCYAMFDGGMDYENYGGEWCTYLYNGANQLVRQPWLTIDATGARRRYLSTASEEGMSNGGLSSQANIQTATVGHRSFVVFDDDYEANIANFNEVHCRKFLTPGLDRMDEYVPEYYQDWHNGVRDALESGVIATADTIPELAEKLGLDADILQKAIDDWNAVCESGVDTARYPYQPEWLMPIVKAPYHGARVGGIVYRTDCGLAINTDMQVVTEKGTIVPGLYSGWFTAAGCYSNGGLKSSTRYSIGGVSLSYTGGYLCANSVMQNEA